MFRILMLLTCLKICLILSRHVNAILVVLLHTVSAQRMADNSAVNFG